MHFDSESVISENDISISAPTIIDDLEAERFVVERPAYRYNVITVITVSTSEVDKVKALITQQSELLTKGVALLSGEYQYAIVYEFTKLNEIKPQMIEEATKRSCRCRKICFRQPKRVGKNKTCQSRLVYH